MSDYLGITTPAAKDAGLAASVYGLERIKWALDPNAPNELFLGDRKLVRDWA